MGSVTPFWHVSHRVRRKPSGRGFLWVSLPLTLGKIRGLWRPRNLFHRGSYEGEGNGPEFLTSHGTSAQASQLISPSLGLPPLVFPGDLRNRRPVAHPVHTIIDDRDGI